MIPPALTRSRATALRVILAFLAVLSLSACSVPRIIVLHDPLSADEHLRLGGIYSSQGKTELARDQYRLAVEGDRKNGKAWQLLGDAAAELKEYKEAEKAYEKAMSLDPKNGDLQNNLAWVYVAQNKRLGKARDLVARAMELTPEHRPYYLDTLGVILTGLGKPQEAIPVLRESIRTLPPDQPGPLSDAYLHLSEAYQAAGDDTSAQEAVAHSRALAAKP